MMNNQSLSFSKKSEIGDVPSDWEIDKLVNLVEKIKSGGTPKSTKKEYYNGEVPFVKIEDITSARKYLQNTKTTISKEGLNNSNAWLVPEGSLLYSIYATVGEVVINKIPVATNQAIINIIPNKKINVDYLYYFFQGIKNNLNVYFKETTQKNLTAQIVKDFKVSVPPLSEQQKIASILSKVDEQIEQTEQIIKKTEILKKGLMQKLLIKGIGHKNFKEVKIGTRHYNIPITWEVKNIESTFFLKGRIGWQGLTTKEYLNEGNYRLVTGTDFYRGRINWNTCVYVSEERYLQDPNIQLKEKDLLVTKDGTIGKIAYIDKLKKPATLNSGIFVLRSLNNECYPEYLYKILNSFYFELFISILKAGSTISHLYQKDFTKFSFPLPELEEQQKIASILSKVDTQIQDNQNYLTKLQELKKGLMQDLLTGRTRVKN